MSAAVGTPPARATLAWRRLRVFAEANAASLTAAVVVFALVAPLVISVIIGSFARGNHIYTGSATLEHYRRVWGEGGVRTIANTVEFAAGSAVLAVLLATIVAFLVERTNAPFRRYAYLTSAVALGIPTLIQTMGWILLIGPNASYVNQLLADVFGSSAPEVNGFSMAGIIFVQAIMLLPAIFLLIAPAMRLADPALEHAASVSGASRARILRTVTLPLATPSLLAALLLAFIVSVESFEVPALMGTPAGIRLLSTAIYELLRSYSPDFGAATALASVLMVVTAAAVYLYQRVTSRAQRYATTTGKAYRSEQLDLGRARWLAGAVTFLIPLIVLAPLLILAWASLMPFYQAPTLHGFSQFTLANYREVLGLGTFRQAAKNSFILGLGSAIIVVLLTLVTSWTVVRRRTVTSRAVDQLISLPLVVPGIVLSLAIARLYISFPITVYGTLWILLLAFVVYFLPYGQRYIQTGLIAVHQELEEVADVSGASRLRGFVTIVVPLIKGNLLAAGLFVFLVSLRQLSLVIFLTTPKNEVVASSMFELWSYGSITLAATTAMLVVAVVAVLAGVLYWLVESDRATSRGSSEPLALAPADTGGGAVPTAP
jgi:iron(III) transport system permease protein